MLKQEQIPVWITNRTTKDAYESFELVKREFSKRFREQCAGLTYRSGVVTVVFVVNLMAAGFPIPRERAVFSGKMNIQYAEVSINYASWTNSDWASRVDLLADAVNKGVAMLPQRRVSAVEAQHLQGAVQVARMDVRDRAPLH